MPRDPQKVKAYLRRYYEKTKETRREARRILRNKWRRANPEKVAAVRARYYATHTDELLAKRRARYLVNGEATNPRKFALRKQLRDQMLEAYGRKCACCGEAGEGFLTLDHFGEYRGVPEPERPGMYQRNYRGSYEYLRLRKMGWPKDGLRILCMNCNWATRRDRPCPHTTMPKA